MKPTLQVRLSQHLALTPQLQQSIRLLQLSTLELHQEVEQMLEQNPFLEADDDLGGFDYSASATASSREEAGTTATSATAESGSTESGGDEPAGLDGQDFGTTERDDWENGTERDDFDGIRETPSAASGAGGDEDFEPQERSAHGPTLQEHLRAQLMGMRLSPQDAAAVHVLIESLDEDGYLDGALEEIVARVAEVLGIEGEEALDELQDQLRCGLRWLQSMEPTGVGAANLSECLTLQLRQRAPGAARECAIAIAQAHLELLARRDLKKLSAATGCDEATVKAAQGLIVGCEPKPGRPFVPAESLVIVPDVIVVKSGRNWKVTLNPDVMPKLKVSDLYAQAIRGQRGGGNLSARLQEARWFIRNIQQRFETIQRVSQAIVERQKAFFTHGEIAMKPLVLREIADELGLHESTISRVTTAKYMATPFGTFELKYFFGSSLNTDAGGNASSTAVRALIKQFVAAEDTKKPLSDSQIADMLEEQGIQVARRTVAKYREALKIAPANLRKAL
ncbi:RNA polymerase factor sigma-54 [Ideonella livida]|uniref:RNA polymerase sigma-54 factor n=1 Tax=Ideonella livida TaxID=2707176 RepID=A0A7C9TP91_9BURK|nr:RNA polymerase factor sigma-54 [Ideonella livida]NDY93506.1 RNA polymerase factor sigma-54 [Ideonella livida]